MTRARSLSKLVNASTFTVDSNNNIGVNSTSPGTKLDINGNTRLGDNNKAQFGAGNDLQVYHDGTDTYLDNTEGDLYLRTITSGDDIIIRSKDDVLIQTQSSEGAIIARGDGTVELYYDNSKKLETKSDGIDVTGEVQCDSLDVDGAADITGDVTLHANLDLQDNDKILIGTGDDLEIYHDGSNSYIADTGTGKLFIRGNSQLVLESNNGENYLAANENGDVHLYYDGGVRLSTKSDGANVVGELECDSLDVDGAADITGNVTLHANLDLQDSDKILLGTGDDLEIYHDGSNSKIVDSGTGQLILQTSAFRVLNAAGSENMIDGDENGDVNLYYNGSEKLKTTSSGVDVTGVLNASGIITAQAGAVAEIGTLSDGATVTPDLATHCNFTITLGGNRTLANPSNVVAGQSGSIFVVQDGTGGRSFNSFGSYWDFIGGTVPTFTSTAGAVDRLDYIVRSSTKIHVVFTANYS